MEASRAVAPFQVQENNKEFQSQSSSLQTLEIALKIIKGLGILLSSLCALGVWAFPLDLVITAEKGGILKIPASLIALPVVLLVWLAAYGIFTHFKEKKAQSLFQILLQNLPLLQSVTEQFKTQYQSIGSMLSSASLLSNRNHAISKDHFLLTLQSIPNVRELTLSAANVPKDQLESITAQLPNLKKLKLTFCQTLTRDDYRFLSGMNKLEEIELLDAIDINFDFIKALADKRGFIVKSSDTNHYIISRPHESGDHIHVGGVSTSSSGGGGVSFNLAWRG